MRMLLTGGAGFIGSHLAGALVARGHEVHVLDDLSTGQRGNVAPDVRLHVGSIVDAAVLQRACEAARAEVVVHLAAQIDVRRSVLDPATDATVNVVGTLAVAAAAQAAGARHLVFASTGAIYGDAACVPTAEDAPERPLAPYGQAKLAAEGYLRLHRELHGLETTVLRFANVYGPGQGGSREVGVISLFCDVARAGGPATVYGDGTQTRDFVYVGDAVAALLAAIDRAPGHGPFNIGTGVETSVNELAALLAVPTRHAPARRADVARSCLDPTRACDELGWAPVTPLADGLAMVLATRELPWPASGPSAVAAG